MPNLPIQFALEPILLPRDQMIAFAERFDPQSFHLSEDAAAGTVLGGLSASAWYVCAKLSDALQVALAGRSLSALIAGAEQIILFSPIRADDVLKASVRVDALRSCACGGRGTDILVDVRRSDGGCVARMVFNFVIGDDVRALPQYAAVCSFRKGRGAKSALRHRIDDIPFFEQIEIGDEIDLGRYTFGPAEIEEFIVRTREGETGANYHLTSCSVPPWHLPAAWMQCMVRRYEAMTATHKARRELYPRLGPAAGFKQIRWHRSIAIGEVISFRGWAERKLVIPSQRDWGLLVVGAEGIDSQGKTVLSFYPQMLLERAGSSGIEAREKIQRRKLGP